MFPRSNRRVNYTSTLLTTPSSFIEADFSVSNGQTRLGRLSCAAPLKIAKTFTRPDAGLSVIVMDASPGLLAGDHYRTEWRLGVGARVEVGAQGFTRVFSSGARPCTLEARFEVAPGACLEWNPEPLVLFRDASLGARTEAHLAPGATLVASEIWCAGRVERGEKFDFARFQNSWRVYRNGAPVFASSLDIKPARLDPRALGAVGDWTHAGNFWAFDDHANEALKNALWDILENPSPLPHPVYAGASLLARGGVMVSLLGRRAHDLQEVIAQLRAATRRHLADCDFP